MEFKGVWKKLSNDVLDAINSYIKKGAYSIDVRKIRKSLGISANDRSKINFIWRFLSYLRDNELIEVLRDKPMRRFKIPSNSFFLFNDQIGIEQFACGKCKSIDSKILIHEPAILQCNKCRNIWKCPIKITKKLVDVNERSLH